MHNTNIPCGCLIEYEGDQTHQDYSIDWCPLHKAAPELLKAAQAGLYFIPMGQPEYRILEAVITKVTKE